MSKDETTPGGLLSKMVKFVRNPTVNWSDLDTLEADRDSQYSKQMLKDLLERKRRNDFVRKREFDQLRKLRQLGAQQGRGLEDALAPASQFSSSLNAPDGRADTLKKIDEIEAQMSQQWWKGKDPGVVTTVAPTLGPLSSAEAGPREPQRPVVAPPAAPLIAAQADVPQPVSAGPVGRLAASDVEPGFPSTAVLGLPAFLDRDLVAPPPPAALEAAPHGEPGPFVHDPDLEEAAIRFAGGDYDGAEQGLREVLAQLPPGDPRQHEVWLTLFDMYRATGAQERFDLLAIDYAAGFGRSAPLWFSLPERLGPAGPADAGAVAAAQQVFGWRAPSTLTTQSVAELQAATTRSAPPWTLDWTHLTDIEPLALAALARQFEDWAERDGAIRCLGVQVLQGLLQSHTVSGERRTDTQWWRLRLAVLRLMGLHDEFEFVALDYCVTYEVSPPSWVSPRCAYSGDDDAQPVALLEVADCDLLATDFGLSQPARVEEGPAAALQGYIDGDAMPALRPLEALARPGAPLVISCDRLIRMDFAAVGSALNWAAEQQAQGRAVHFTQLHRLVAVLFNLIGMNEHALVVPRAN